MNIDWREIEIMGYTYYTAKGYRILLPIIDKSHYDFVAEKHGHFVRVNVKKATFVKQHDNGNIQYNLYGSGPKAKPKLHADIILTWISDQGRFIEMPANMLDGKKSCKIPQKLLTSK